MSIAIIGVTFTCRIFRQELNTSTAVYIDRLGGSATLSGIGLVSVVWDITNDNLGFTFTICCALALIAASFVAALAIPSITYRCQNDTPIEICKAHARSCGRRKA